MPPADSAENERKNNNVASNNKPEIPKALRVPAIKHVLTPDSTLTQEERALTKLYDIVSYLSPKVIHLDEVRRASTGAEFENIKMNFFVDDESIDKRDEFEISRLLRIKYPEQKRQSNRVGITVENFLGWMYIPSAICRSTRIKRKRRSGKQVRMSKKPNTIKSENMTQTNGKDHGLLPGNNTESSFQGSLKKGNRTPNSSSSTPGDETAGTSSKKNKKKKIQGSYSNIPKGLKKKDIYLGGLLEERRLIENRVVKLDREIEELNSQYQKLLCEGASHISVTTSRLEKVPDDKSFKKEKEDQTKELRDEFKSKLINLRNIKNQFDVLVDLIPV